MGTGLGTVAAAPGPAVGGGRGRRRPHRATSQTRETLRHLWSPSATLSSVPPTRAPLRGANSRVPGEGAAQDRPLHVPLDSVSPQSLFVNEKRHAGRIHSSRGVARCRVEIPRFTTRVFSLVALVDGGGSWVSLLWTSWVLPTVRFWFLPAAPGEVWLDVLIVGDGGCGRLPL